MDNRNARFILPTCAVVASLFGVAIIRYSLGMYLEVIREVPHPLPPSVSFAWKIHDARWLLLLAGLAALVFGWRRARSEPARSVLSGLYMLAWFFLCFLVQFCLVYGLMGR